MFSERKVQSTLATPTTIPMINAAKQENIRRSFRTLIIPTLPLYAIEDASVLGETEASTDRASGWGVTPSAGRIL